MKLFGSNFVNSQSSLGLDFGNDSCKMLALNKVGDRIDISLAGAVEMPFCSIENGVIQNPKEVGKRIKNFLAEHSMPNESPVFDVPSSMAIMRWVNLPQMAPEERLSAARFRVRKHLPFSVESAYIECWTPPADPKADVQTLVIAVPKDIVDSRAEAIMQAGMEPLRAELEAQSILRVVERRLNRRSALWRDASLTIIDFGYATTHMYVVQNQQLQFIRGVKFGSAFLHSAVMQALECTTEDAAAILHDPRTSLNFDGVLSGHYGDALAIINLSHELDKLRREITRLMRYFRSLHPERSYSGILDQALLVGGLVGLTGLDQYLSHHLGLKTEYAKPISGMMTRFSKETFAAVSKRQEAFTIAMGLALAGLDETQQGGNQKDGGTEFSWTRSA
jgi:type IV pilus assembly protein PilM